VLSHCSSIIAPTLGEIGKDGDPPGRRFAADTGFLGFDSLFADKLQGLLFIAAGFLKRFLDFHQRQAGALAQRLDHGRGYFWHDVPPLFGCLSVIGTGRKASGIRRQVSGIRYQESGMNQAPDP
jgi:hypothetical protein